MALKKYQAKRKFSETPEPKGAERSADNEGKPRFVVQEHQASTHHYDFRLEVGNVLKSWALPKGPTMNPSERHLAVMVEDHPLEYRSFEGTIPEGNYGAGSVIVWDEGFYRPVGSFASGTLARDLVAGFEEGLAAGHLVFVLAGHKLNGEFALIKLRRGGDNFWLLVKARDKFATDDDVLKKNRSVKTHRSIKTLEKMKVEPPKDPFPQTVKPMLATLVSEVKDDPNMAYEIKWDGYRGIALIQNGKPHLYSRNNLSFNERFPELVASLSKIKKETVLDGEIVAVNKKGHAGFQLLQSHLKTGEGSLVYYVFDVLYYDGFDLTGLPYLERRKVLEKILPGEPNIKISENVVGGGKAFFEVAKKQGLEGIIGKKLESTYQPGGRSKDWIKVKAKLEQEMIIAGFTKPAGSRVGFGSLLLGVYERGKLTYVGNVGTGFSEALIQDLMKRMKPLVTKKSPFAEDPKLKDVTWLRPELVCEVTFQEWTSDGKVRQAVFLGLREDKNPDQVKKEVVGAR